MTYAKFSRAALLCGAALILPVAAHAGEADDQAIIVVGQQQRPIEIAPPSTRPTPKT
jgi:hypothetical protein